MRRRRLLAIAVATCLLTPADALAQGGSGKTYRLAVLAPAESTIEVTETTTLPALAKLGFERGRNLQVNYGVGAPDRLPEILARLLAARPDVINAVGADTLQAARRATPDIPIVMFGPDPVQLGLVRSFTNHGSNLTGISILGSELDAKRLQLLHETAPAARRFASLLRPTFGNTPQSERDMRQVAAASGVAFTPIYVSGPVDYTEAFARMRAAGVDALVIPADPTFFRDKAALAALARQNRLPTICQWREMAVDGCLLSYGPDLTSLRQRLADFIARILRGTHPRDMPIEQPTTFQFVVNLREARTLGIAIPQTVLARADEVIE